MPVGPKPHNSTPLTYKNKGIMVIGPARKINSIIGGSENWKSFYGPCYLKRLDLPTQTFRLTASFSGWFYEKNPDYEFVVFFCCGFKNIIRCSTVNGCQVLPAVHKRSTLHQFSTFCYIKKVTGVSEEFTSQSNYCSRSHIVRCFQSLVFLLIFF